MVSKKMESNELYYIIIIILIILVLYFMYIIFNKRTKLYENYNNNEETDENGVSKDPMAAYNEGYNLGKNNAKKEINNAITHTKNEKCVDSAFYTWGRINGLAHGYQKYTRGDKFGKACNEVEGSQFKNYITVGYRLKKI